MTEYTADRPVSEVAQVRRKHRHEGPKNHLLAFVLSILLTAFAFVAVAYTVAGEEFHIEPWFVHILMVILAIFQAVVQLAFWMHMKDKGHGWPIVFIAFGFLVALTLAASALFWSWW